MIETLFSLKLILIAMVAILALDEMFLSLQTAQTTNFFAARAAIVGQDFQAADRHFQKTIQKRMIFTKDNPFFTISPLETHKVRKQFKTHVGFKPMGHPRMINHVFTQAVNRP